MFSLAQEQRVEAVNLPPRANFSRITEKEWESTYNFQSYVTAAAELGRTLKKVFCLVTALDSQIHSYRKQLKQIKRTLPNIPGSSSDRPPILASDVSSQPSKTDPQSLTPKQLEEIRGKFIYDFKYVQNPKHHFRPITPHNEPSLSRDLASKARKSQNLRVRKTALKREIVTLARELEKTKATKDSPKIKLSAVPYHASEAFSSEYGKRFGTVMARVRQVLIATGILKDAKCS